MTYSGEGQLDRLGQRPQRARKTASASSRALETRDGLIGTTLAGSGPTSPEMRVSRAEQAAGSVGMASNRKAPSSTSAAVASGSELCIAQPPSDHGLLNSPDEKHSSATAKLENVVTFHTSKLNMFDDEPVVAKWPGYVVVPLVLGLCGLLWWAIIYAVWRWA